MIYTLYNSWLNYRRNLLHVCDKEVDLDPALLPKREYVCTLAMESKVVHALAICDLYFRADSEKMDIAVNLQKGFDKLIKMNRLWIQ